MGLFRHAARGQARAPSDPHAEGGRMNAWLCSICDAHIIDYDDMGIDYCHCLCFPKLGSMANQRMFKKAVWVKQ